MNDEDSPRVRFMPPEDDWEVMGVRGTDINKKIFHPEGDMHEILISGCLPTEYSYDARIGGQYRGAMSYFAIDILKRYPNITYENFYKKLQTKLPSRRYPQTPQLEGSIENKQRVIFS